ncbi:hypothetical protein Q8F55_003666 [Vanrija albida]|uniref:DOPA 4,5-dioxygenase n=1 Tax=Vanrija albida TaxID=181172 RepID=A0ABR3Q4V0_9TREE
MSSTGPATGPSTLPATPLTPFYPKYAKPSVSYPTDNLEPLSYEADPNGSGKTVYNPPRPDGKKSPHYDAVWDGEGGKLSKPWWDFHIYHLPLSPQHVEHAHALYAAVRREFPELPTYRFWDKPLGPHPIPMFEVNVRTPHELGALFSWFVANRGPCSVLIHPNTGDDPVDHTTHATWIGDKVPLDVDMLRAFQTKVEGKEAK